MLFDGDENYLFGGNENDFFLLAVEMDNVCCLLIFREFCLYLNL